MTTLIAGFAPFPGAPFNPSGDLISSLQEEGIDDQLHVECLPVGWEKSWPALRAAIEAHRPQSVVLFGLHMTCERLRLELVAKNRRELGREDAFGSFPAGPNVFEGPEHYRGSLPWSKVAALLRAEGLDFEWSTNAGAYLCNDTYYRLAHHAVDYGIANYGFVHVPISDERVSELVESGLELPTVFNSIDAAALRRFARSLTGMLEAEN